MKFLSPAERQRTILGVTIGAAGPTSEIARLLRGESVTVGPGAIDATLLTAARLVVLELDALRASSTGDAGRIAAEVHRIAVERGVATIGAIGVTCMLAGELRRPSGPELAATLGRARASFTDRELLDGAAAVCGAACSVLAATFALDPDDVAALIDAVARRHDTRCGGRRFRRHPTPDRCQRSPGRRSSP